jgi:phospholipid-binding lipoprotein MlaA
MRAVHLAPALRAASLALGLALAACATQPPADDPYAVSDPLEGINRPVFAFNDFLDRNVLEPVARGYRDVVPGPVRKGVRNFLNNLRSPVILFNDAVQGEGKLAGDTFARMWLNTILGVGGIMDVGTQSGIPFHDADFGQTLGVWGVGGDPYLVLPIFGPSSPRDTVGLVADSLADPANGLAAANDVGWVVYIRDAVSGIDTREQYIDPIERIRSTSLDYYAAIRSLYRQRRAAEILHEQPPENAPPAGLP